MAMDKTPDITASAASAASNKSGPVDPGVAYGTYTHGDEMWCADCGANVFRISTHDISGKFFNLPADMEMCVSFGLCLNCITIKYLDIPDVDAEVQSLPKSDA